MKKLTMDNIKEFVENKVVLEWMNVDDKDDEWEEYPYTYNKSDIIKDMIDLNYYFRYRIQDGKNYVNNANSEWIKLVIDNPPERFFTRDDIEIAIVRKSGSLSIDGIRSKVSERLGIISNTLKGIKYCYRIKEKKEPMRMTVKAFKDLVGYDINITIKDKGMYQGREVIIID